MGTEVPKSNAGVSCKLRGWSCWLDPSGAAEDEDASNGLSKLLHNCRVAGQAARGRLIRCE
jgi:hypothetical protein